jgi:hypothetical protein
MTEILTESFCERCGTRYTFESSAPRRSRLGRVRTLSKGVRNFVMSDESSFSEAMADARSEEELSATAHQLDAFHQTFNFCLTCRQYTCANCWNAAEGRCLTCAPIPGMEEPAAAAALAAIDGNGHAHLEDDELWPETDLTRLATVLGEAPPSGEAAPGSQPVGLEDRSAPAPTPEDVQEPIAPIAPPAGIALDDERAMFAAETAQTAPSPLLGVAPGQSIEDAIAAYEQQLDAAGSAEAGAVDTPVEVPEPTIETPAPPALHEIRDVEPGEPQLPAAAMAAFSPVEADESQAELIGVTPARPEPMSDLALQPAAHLAAPADAPAAPMPGPPVTPAPAAGAPATSGPAPEPSVPATPQAAPPPPPANAADVIVQPTWPVATPPPEPVAPPEPGAPPAPPQPSVAPWLRVAPDETQPRPEPQWPAAGAWPVTPNRELPTTLVGRPLLPRDDAAALWAASAQEVLGPAPASQPAPLATAQPCVQCGLSLSANARFCRRCGSRQG